MLQDRKLVSRLARLGLGLVLVSSISACGEPEPPKVIDTNSQPKIPVAGPSTKSVDLTK